AGRLLIEQDGTCVYSPDSAPSSLGSQSESYRLSITRWVTCDITDPDGNHFQAKRQERMLFLARVDGSGTELLVHQEVEGLLGRAHSDPGVAVLSQSDDPGESTVTILRPVQRLLGKHNLNIVPLNLRNRNWYTFPRVERKTWGPPFGSDLGRGLALGGGPRVQALEVQDHLGQPQVRQVQELTVYPATSRRLRHTLDTRLKDFMERLVRREQLSEDLRVSDPHSEKEEEEEEEKKDQLSEDLRVSDPHREEKDEEELLSEDTRRRDSRWWRVGVQPQDCRQELTEDRARRSALRSQDIVPYFHPENAQLHQELLLLLGEGPDMNACPWSSHVPPSPPSLGFP
ncbi:hypothetical protein CRUP_028169, partial [Coryphaenoides rupestris]